MINGRERERMADNDDNMPESTFKKMQNDKKS